MSQFLTYLKLGFLHITDINGFDHILFLVALCAVYSLKDWKGILLMVTAFTLGHSTTLALAVFDIVRVNSELIECIIPITILLTCLVNFSYLFPQSIFKKAKDKGSTRYSIAAIFGLIHGLGFSSYLRSLMGSEGSIALPLFSFNIGLELGQVLIVLFILCFNFIITNFFKLKQRNWNLIVSGIVFVMSLILLFERI